jgi:hypothetical protein
MYILSLDTFGELWHNLFPFFTTPYEKYIMSRYIGVNMYIYVFMQWQPLDTIQRSSQKI